MKRLVITTTVLVIALFALTISCNKDDDKAPADGSYKIQTINGLKCRVYENKAGGEARGIIVLGSGNNENDPTEGNLDGFMLNTLSARLSDQGYIAAIVAYRDQPASPDYSNWNSNTAMLATDLSSAASGLIDQYGGSRSKVVLGGESYTAYALLSQSANGDIFKDCKGLLSVCGGTSPFNAGHQKIPLASIACYDDFDAEYNLNGEDLVAAIANAGIKTSSAGLRDKGCSGHCNGNTDEWCTWLTKQVQKWLP